jgi:hypothetical protein
MDQIPPFLLGRRMGESKDKLITPTITTIQAYTHTVVRGISLYLCIDTYIVESIVAQKYQLISFSTLPTSHVPEKASI